jgi:biopolymer transport protein ExbD
MTTFLNLMVVLVPFLLITAVFSRITIVELTLPSSTGGSALAEPSFRVEVIVREQTLELTDGSAVIARFPNVDDQYDLGKLSEYLVSMKRENPDSDDASVLLEPHIQYDDLIQVMDAVRSAAVAADGEESLRQVALFTNIAIGDAP